MANILIAIIGEDKDAKKILEKSFSEFMPDKIVLLVKKSHQKNAKKVIKLIQDYNIKYETKELSDFVKLEEIFIKIKEISQIYNKDNLVIQVDCDYMTSCLALSSAFVNGILAIGILKDKIIAYPIMKFSYYNAINEKKLNIIKILKKHKKIDSMEELAKLSKLSLPLIAYHLRGNKDSKGLIEMNLVKVEKKGKNVNIKLTELGNLIANGIIDYNCNSKTNCM